MIVNCVLTLSIRGKQLYIVIMVNIINYYIIMYALCRSTNKVTTATEPKHVFSVVIGIGMGCHFHVTHFISLLIKQNPRLLSTLKYLNCFFLN